MRVIINEEPFTDVSRYWRERGLWPANWVGHPQVRGVEPAVVAYRRKLSLDSECKVRIHVTADERYELFLDGERVGRGPERSDIDNWFFESYDLNMTAGEHILVARTWWLGTDCPAPYAQLSVRPGFLLAAENMPDEILNTGVAKWECKKLEGYNWLSPEMAWGTGVRVHIKGCDFAWGFETGNSDDWQDVETISRATNSSVTVEWTRTWLLKPAMLPAMFEQLVKSGDVRYVQSVKSENTRSEPVDLKSNLISEVEEWNRMFAGGSSLTVPANTIRRVIIDIDNYCCAYPEIVLSGGLGSKLMMNWAESLFTENVIKEVMPKGNRDEIDGKFFIGVGDVFETDGKPNRKFDTLWWRAGRYIEIVVSTGDFPLTIENLKICETRYPYEMQGEFECDNKDMNDVVPLAVRSLQMCSHETFMDCPYYEQLMYVGDSRLEALTTYVTSADDRLPRKAVWMFDCSRKNTGLTQAQYPSRSMQIIPPFSLFWISMVSDYAMWRNDPDFVADRMQGVRSVIDAFARYINDNGLVEAPNGWNYVDWVPAWYMGIPPDGEHGVSCIINWQMVIALRQAAELESLFGDAEIAIRNRRLADSISQRINDVFWDNNRGLFADDMAKKHFSEHSQCLAVLSGSITDSYQINNIADGLLNDPDIVRTTIYFRHYLFEAYRILGIMDNFAEQMKLWFDLKKLGLKTTIESPEPSRSDCHAWGAHPLFHYFASILGIRPSSAGFENVRIEPQLGSLKWASGVMSHPKGLISVDFAVDCNILTGNVSLPDGVTGILVYDGKIQQLYSGKQEIYGLEIPDIENICQVKINM